jgi:hypothetical protein
MLLAARPAAASITLLVNEPIEITGAVHAGGHAAIQFSNVCADRLDEVRLCRPGEDGIVLTTYQLFTPDFPYYWVATPPSIYLYGVESFDAVPVFGPRSAHLVLERQFAASRLTSTAKGDPAGYWRYVVGVTFRRTVYSYRIETTPEQDARAVAALNEIQHVRRFDLTYNNCSDFSRWVINTYFPGAVHRDGFNDLSFTTPKAVARTFTRFGRLHPELGFAVDRYAQLENARPRSHGNRSITEEFVTSPKYLALTLLASPYLTGTLGAVYLTTGRFSLEGTYTHSADHPRMSKADRQTFGELTEEAVRRGLFRDRGALERLAHDLERYGEAEPGPAGDLRMRVRGGGGSALVGLTRAGLRESWSDPALSYALMLTVMSRQLSRSGAEAPSAGEFASDLALLRELRSRDGVFERPVGQLTCAREGEAACPSVTASVWKRLLRVIVQ